MWIVAQLDILFNRIETGNKYDDEPIKKLKKWEEQNFLNNTRFHENINRLANLQEKGWKIIVGDIINGSLKITLIKNNIDKEQASVEIESSKLLDTRVTLNDVMDLLSVDIDICY
ncbi:MAG: hypothetical protein JW829_06230 [Pirellulales bacterium]|nr:hypothetical protein [Pirellulales bacterium]